MMIPIHIYNPFALIIPELLSVNPECQTPISHPKHYAPYPDPSLNPKSEGGELLYSILKAS
jgi:hypothetical protein